MFTINDQSSRVNNDSSGIADQFQMKENRKSNKIVQDIDKNHNEDSNNNNINNNNSNNDDDNNDDDDDNIDNDKISDNTKNKMVRVHSFQHQDSFLLYNDSDVLNEFDAELFRDGTSIMDCSNSEYELSRDCLLTSESEPNDLICYQEDTKSTPTQELAQAEVVKKTDSPRYETRKQEEGDLTPTADTEGWNDRR